MEDCTVKIFENDISVCTVCTCAAITPMLYKFWRQEIINCNSGWLTDAS